ncbi:HAMP domain-containing sensor histidine kinase [Sphingomonas sp. PWP1-2]|uniref:sensor histidine kinase n=1 Tax=Sphingomonas sp. PWP1-2 TaxID=2804558 RepID=UPI003CF794AB
MIEPFKRVVRRHWPRLRLRTILLLTFVFVATLPGFGALFLRVYENSLVRQTEAELVSQSAALAAIAAADWPGPGPQAASNDASTEATTVDLRMSQILPELPAPHPVREPEDGATIAWANRLAPILRVTARTTLSSIQLLDANGRILVGHQAGFVYRDMPELRSVRAGRAATTLRRNDTYRRHYVLEWLSRASDLRIHHARPVIVDGRVIGILLLSRSPRALFAGIYADRGKILFGVALIFGALVVLSGLLSRGIVRPVEALGEATRAVASGRGAVPDPPTTAAVEIQALYRDFGLMAEAIDRRSRYLRDFAHAVSHEFKTPLAGIGGAVELLQDHADMEPADRQRFLTNIGADAARLNLLVSRLLDLARADMAEVVEGAAADLAEIMHCTVDAYDGAAFSVSVTTAPDMPSVAVPRAVLETTLTGLIENSRQAGAYGVLITAYVIDNRGILTLRDDGPGIAIGDRERIFEPFFTSRRASGGTGLGLPIIRSLLQAHKGTIGLDQSVGGAAFLITLPLCVPFAT